MVGIFQHFKVYHHVARKEYPVLHAVLLQLVILQKVETSIRCAMQLHTQVIENAPVLVPMQQ